MLARAVKLGRLKPMEAFMRLFCIVMCLVASTAGAGTYQDILDQLAHPTLASNANTVTDLEFTLGNATFTISGEAEGNSRRWLAVTLISCR